MASSSLGRLTLDLAVKLGSFEQGMSQAERKTKDSTDKMNRALTGFKNQFSEAFSGSQIGSIFDNFNNKMGSIKGGAVVAGAAIAGMAVGGIALGIGALSKMAIDAAKADSQLLVLSNRANTSAENFQILERAAAGLGVSQDQLGAILADAQEKLGEFSATQGGGAKDFFDALKNNTKMSEDQIKSFGKTLQGKDGVEAIQILNNKLDELGVTTQERRFVFESLASDLGNLAPIFAENGELLKQYGDALKDAGVIKSKEALEQSRLLAAQTESVQMRFDGFKNQLTSQMMPVLNSLASYFIDGATKGGQFGSVIQSVGVIAKGVGVVIIGIAASIEVMIKVIAGLIDQAKNVASTAVNVWNADGFVAKAKATWNGLSNAGNIAVGTFVNGATAIQNAIDGAKSVMDSSVTKTDELTKANLAISEASKRSASGLKTDTKTADDNAKAKEKAAKATQKLSKEQENLNKMVGASALSGLRIKSGEAFSGGQVRGYTANFAQLAQKQLGSNLGRFTAFNDSYHKGTNSKHATGNAFDFTLDDASKSDQAVSQLESIAKRYGYLVKVIDEYKNPSSRATGGHLHVSVLGFNGTADAAKQADAELSIIEKANEEDLRIKQEKMRLQQSVMQNYFTDEEKLTAEHQKNLKDIASAFGVGTSMYERYLEKENAAFNQSLTQKTIEEKKQLLEVRKNWISASEYAQQYYALVREEILNTSKYSPEMKDAKIKEANIQEGVEANSERENVWDDYKSMMGLDKSPYQQDMDLLAEARKQMLITEDEYQQKRLQLQGLYGGQYAADFAGMMMGLVDSSSTAYAILGGIQKGFTLFSVAMSSADAIGKAWASATFPYNMPAVAMATMETGLLQAAVSALSPVGMAHNGIDNIPKEGTWLLDGGERVLNPKQNKDLTNYLANSKSNSSQITINNNANAQVNTRQNSDGSIDIDLVEKQLAGRLRNPNSVLSKSVKSNTTASRRR